MMQAAGEEELSSLSDEVLLLIFRYVGWADVARGAAGVCRRWREVSFDQSLWRTFARHHWPGVQEEQEDRDWRAWFLSRKTRGKWWRHLSFKPLDVPCPSLKALPPIPSAGFLSIPLAVVGPSKVGKSCMTIQMTANHFIEEWHSVAEDSYRKRVVIDGQAALMEIYDFSGSEEFAALRPQWFSGHRTFLVVYSATSFDSFAACEAFVKAILAMLPDEERQEKFLPAILVENKVDLCDEREVPKDAGPAAARAMGMLFTRVSSKTREGVDDAFFSAARLHMAPLARGGKIQKKKCHIA